MFTVYVGNVSDGISWFDASKRCGKEGLEYDVKVLSNLYNLTDNNFWLGLAKYKELTPWMELLGMQL